MRQLYVITIKNSVFTLLFGLFYNMLKMEHVIEKLRSVFKELDGRISLLNQKKLRDGSPTIAKTEIILLGQTSLLVNEKVSAILTLAQTADIDAKLNMEYGVKQEFKLILKKHRLIYDEDSNLVWIPPGSKFEEVLNHKNVLVKAIDAESALVSKAVKSPGKNKQLIRQAIASRKFRGLVERILKNGGNLEVFAND